MKILNKLFILAGLILGVISCDYLDVVPDDAPTLDDAFKNRAAAEKSLFACFSYLPDPTNPYYYPAYFTSHDEFEIGLSSWVKPMPAYIIGNGDLNTNDPAMNYFSGDYFSKSNAKENLFQAIRECNTFLGNIEIPRDMEETERLRWIAEVKFLKAYYHFFLLELYGPIPLIKENLPLNSSPEEVRIYREPIDECIDYIVGLINEAVPNLPLIPPFPTEDNGRITQPIALAVKAKALVWAASPLFNGNSDYAGWIDKRGKQLISSTYSKEKWERAAIAIKNAIDTCHLAGLGLYEYNPALSAQTFAMNDSLVRTMTHRKAITERWNKGVIWASTEVFANGKGWVSYASYGNFQRALMPRMYAQDVNAETSFLYASMNMAETYYSKNGIPIEEDESWGYGNRYKTQVSTLAVGNTYYIQPGQVSAYLNFNREPRFYASLGFDRGYFELSTETANGGKSFNTALQLRFGEAGSGTNATGYAVKKLVAFETSASRGSTYAYAGYDYRFPLIRLADLYLLYSEALNEIKASPDAEVYEWIDQVRRVAGLKGVVESWELNSNNPNRPKDKDEMRKIIQQERMIELAFEGQRFWDVRRWKLAAQLWTKPTYGWDFNGKTADDYYVRKEVFPGRKFTFKDYLWPIRQSDLRINNNLEQTYGW